MAFERGFLGQRPTRSKEPRHLRAGSPPRHSRDFHPGAGGGASTASRRPVPGRNRRHRSQSRCPLSAISAKSRLSGKRSHAGRLTRPGPDPMQAHTMRPQPGFGGSHVFGQASHGLPERERMVHVPEVRDLMRREVIKHERRRHDEAPGEIQLP